MTRDSLSFYENPSEPGTVNALYAAIGKASASFPDLPRTATGQIGKDRKFQYAPYHKVVKCIRGPLAENGVSFMQPIHSDGDGMVSITLLVCGHGAAIESTLRFKQSDDPKVFGADTTYHKRYQLTSFFGLEGDPDADDFETDLAEVAAKATKPVASKPEAKKQDSSTDVATGGPSKSGEVAKNPEAQSKVSAESKSDEAAKALESVQKVDKRPIGEKLTDAMKQLVWKMADFDAFCKNYPEEFPDFVGAARLPPEKQQRLYELLVLHKGVVAF